VEPCPNCASELTEALRSDVGGGIRLRCPECESCFRATVGARAIEVGRLEARQVLIAAYEASVDECMSSLADSMAEALARDLLSADDFRTRRAA